MTKQVYLLINKETGAKVKSTQDYLTAWLARGFEVEEMTGGLLKDIEEDTQCYYK